MRASISFSIFLFVSMILLISNQGYTQAAMLDDKETRETISRGLEKMYNLEFGEAEKYFLKVKQKYPDHPAYDLLNSMSLNWEMMYDNSFAKRGKENLSYLEEAVKKAAKLLEKNSDDPEGIFFTLAGRASIALYYAQTNETLKSVNEARKAYYLIKKADVWKDQLMDFNLPVGLYNYYVVQYPENHPVFKPFMFFFMKGNKIRGLELMDKCSRLGVLSRTEATYYLSHIYLRYEEDYAKSIIYGSQLVREFPNNIYFKINYCEALIGNRQYKEAEHIAYDLYKSNALVGKIASYTYYGLLHEKYFNNPEKARNYYNQGIQAARSCEFPVGDFTGQCYAGLGRVYHVLGEKEKAREAYKKCLEETDYLSLMREAKNYLNKYE